MGLAALVSGVIMLLQLNAKLKPATRHPRWPEVWAKHWEYGKWALGHVRRGLDPKLCVHPASQ